MNKNILSILTLSVLFWSCGNSGKQETQDVNKQAMKIKYPETKTVNVTDNYFGKEVKDPYRWLENDTAADVEAWVKEQNKVTDKYLAEIPFRKKIEDRLTKLWNYPKFSTPFKKKGYVFYYKNDGLQNQSVLYVTKDIKKEGRVLLDPNKLSKDGTVALASMGVSQDGKYLAYGTAVGGSDWNEIYVKEIESGKMLEDHIEWVKFSSISWDKDGFYYSGYDAPEEGKELSQKNEFHKMYYHKLGTPQSEDKIVMQDTENALNMFFGGVTDDGKYLIVYEETQGARGMKVHVKDLDNPKAEFVSLIDNFEHEYGVIDNEGKDLFVKTNIDAPKYRLVKINMDNFASENWTEIIPESENVLKSVSISGGKLIASYMKDAYSLMEVYDFDGTKNGKIDLPGIGTVGSFHGNKDEDLAFYSFTGYTFPNNIYTYNVKTGKSELYKKSKIDFDAEKYETKQVFYESKDGTKIPMFITHKKGIKLDGTNPTLLYGYGGFNVSLTPSFSITNVVWMEAGGVFAVANLRGGGEYGQDWHEQGMKLNKQNVFDDFIAAAEYLIKEKYTSSEKLAIRGGSNGGLLVGAVANQRPELFQVAIPAVGVMDMLRFHKFTIGWNWVTDYGSSEDSTDFFNLIKYSPIHNVKSEKDYPATLVMTADHDDRVVPAHSFKYIAELQKKWLDKNPVLIRIETMAGHSAGKPTSKIIEEYADMWAFILYNLGEDYK